MRTRHLVAALLVVTLAACGSSATSPSPTASPAPSPTATPVPSAGPTQAPSPSATSGGTSGRTGHIDVPGGKFSITLAPGWVEVALTPEDVKAIANAFPPGSEFGKTLAQQLPTLLAAGVKLWALDLQAVPPGTNLNVIMQPSIQMSLTLLKTIAQQGVAQIPGIEGTPTVSDTKVGGQDAVQITYRLTQQMATGGTVTVDGTQVYVSTATALYIFTFTIMAGGSSADISPMIDSITFTP